MHSLPVVNTAGEVVRQTSWPAEIIPAARRDATSVMHQAVLRQLANRRQGTHDTRTRAEVRGGGAKPYRQKGTGRARQGSRRAPQWVGGGTVFGPHPGSYRQRMPRKQRRLAAHSALTSKVENITVWEGMDFDVPRTKTMVTFLRNINAGARVLLVLGSHHEAAEKSARNIPELRVTLASNLSVADLIAADTVVMTPDALTHLVDVVRS